MSISKTRTIQLLVAAGLLAVGLAAPDPASAQTGYECILDTEDGGSSMTTADTDQGADANGTSSNLACGGSSVAGADGENTAIGVGSMAGVGAGNEQDNTAVGEGAMAGVGDNSTANTATGEDADAGVGAGSSLNAAYGESSNAGVGADSDNNAAFGQSADAGVGDGSSDNSAFGRDSGAGVGADSDENSAFGSDAMAGIGDGKSGNTAIGDSAEANTTGSDGSDGATAVGASATANFDRSTALGADATATRANQMVYGTATETHTMPGITSMASLDAQDGPLALVTTDADGDLATDGGQTFGRVRRNQKHIDDNAEGIAMAMSIQDPDLVGDERLGLKVGWGTFSGENAMGVSAGGVLVPDIGAGIRLGIAGGAAFGLERGGIGGRAAMQLSW